jgi:hypothetical protein
MQDLYEKVYAKVQEERCKNHDIAHLYYIQLFDKNCVSCTSGVTNVFVEDIDAFSNIYQGMGVRPEELDRFLRSKAGEIVTDYYTNDPDLNIVQHVEVEDLGYFITCRRDQKTTVMNRWRCASDYYWGVLVLEVRWVKFKNQYYKLVKPSGWDCAAKNDFDDSRPWRRMEVVGNPFWIYAEKEKTPYQARDISTYQGTSLKSYVWQVADIFHTQEEMEEDKKMLSDKVLTDIQTIRVFADIPGGDG